MPTRSRVRAKPAAEAETEEKDFFPDSVVTGTVNNPQSPEAVDEDDDGTISSEPIEGQEDLFDENEQDDGQEQDDDQPDNGGTPATGLGGTKTGMTEGQQAAAAELRNYVERVERLAAEIAEIQTDVKDLYGEMKNRGYDTKAVKELVKIRSKDPAKLKEQLAILHVYAHALGLDEDLL